MEKIPGKSLVLKRNNFRSVNVEIVNEFTTLVPAALFREEDAEKFFSFNFKPGDDLLKSEKIPAFDAVNVYAYPKSLDVSIQTIFQKPVIHHQSTVLLQAIHLQFKKFTEKSLLIHVRSGFVDIVVTEGKQLIFINSFPFATVDDLAYYVMFVCDRLQLNPETTRTSLAGHVEEESTLFHLLYKYIKNISFVNRPDVFEYSYVFDDVPAHFYYHLFNLPLCES